MWYQFLVINMDAFAIIVERLSFSWRKFIHTILYNLHLSFWSSSDHHIYIQLPLLRASICSLFFFLKKKLIIFWFISLHVGAKMHFIVNIFCTSRWQSRSILSYYFWHLHLSHYYKSSNITFPISYWLRLHFYLYSSNMHFINYLLGLL